MVLHMAGVPSLRLNNIPPCVHTTLKIHSSIGGHLGCVQVLATVSRAVTKVGIVPRESGLPTGHPAPKAALGALSPARPGSNTTGLLKFFLKHENYPNYPAAAAATAKSLQSCPTLCDPID